MRSAEQLRALLKPLGIYKLDSGVGAGELISQGAALDQCAAALEGLQREMSLATATGEGLDAVERLLSRRPVTTDPERRRRALAALLRVGGDSFTLAAINDNLKGCGLNAVASEGAAAHTVEVRFPEVPGIPDGFAEMRGIIEDILPCHLAIQYVYWYVTWAMMEARFASWSAVEKLGLSWEKLEKLVQ